MGKEVEEYCATGYASAHIVLTKSLGSCARLPEQDRGLNDQNRPSRHIILQDYRHYKANYSGPGDSSEFHQLELGKKVLNHSHRALYI